MTDVPGISLPAAAKGDGVSFGSLFVLSFVVLLAFALVGALLTLDWRHWLPGAEGEKSIVGGVRASVYTFMSYLT